MATGRLEAFSDAVIAIIMTIMVLELKVPHEATWAALDSLIPVFLSYVLSFIYLGIYWNNHHHLLQVARQVNGSVLWANMHLLFWLSLVPFATGWMGENHFAALPVALYGAVLLLAAAIGGDFKGKISLVVYALAIPFAFVNAWLACGLYALVALMWLIPDRRIERALKP
jgi:uncharacterized membrane protein